MEHGICKPCVNRYLWIKITNEKIISIPCPAENCIAILEYNEIKEHGGPEAFTRYPFYYLANLVSTSYFAGGHMNQILISGGAQIVLAQPVKLLKEEVVRLTIILTFRGIFPFRLCDLSIQVLFSLSYTPSSYSFVRGKHDFTP